MTIQISSLYSCGKIIIIIIIIIIIMKSKSIKSDLVNNNMMICYILNVILARWFGLTKQF